MTSNTAQNPTAAAQLSPQSSVLSTSPLPHLSPAEAKTLSAFLANPSLGAACDELHILPTEMLRFLSQPHIAAYLALAKQLVADRDCLESVGVLREVMAIPENTPAERRRAASTILRFHQSAAKLAAQPADDPADTGQQPGTKRKRSDTDNAAESRPTAEPRATQNTSTDPTSRSATEQRTPAPAQHVRPADRTAADPAHISQHPAQHQPAAASPHRATQLATAAPFDANAALIAHDRLLAAAT